MPEPTTPPVCGAVHDTYPETLCTEPPLHRLPHGGPLIIDGRECGGAAWGPDHGTAPRTPGQTETGATTANAQAAGVGAGGAPADTEDPERAPGCSGQPANDLNVGLREALETALYPTYGQQDRERTRAITDAVLAVVQPRLDRLALAQQGAADREALLTEARDALEAAGETGPHGDDWPQIAPGIRALAGRAETRRQQLTRAVGIPDDATWLEALVAVVKAHLGRGRAEATVRDYENRITWETNCGEHAALLDSAYAETIRREQAEAAIARVRAECDRIETAVRTNPTAPDFDGAYLACLGHIRTALTPSQPATTNGA